MLQEIVQILAILSPLAALVFGYFSFNNSRKQNERKEAEEKTTIIIKLENINDTVKDIKSDISSVKSELSDLTERLIKVEASVASAHKRIDGLDK